MREEWRRDLILILLTLVVAGVLYTLATGGGERAAAAPVAAATMTPTVAATPLATLAVGARVEAAAVEEMEAEQILDLAERLLDMTEAILQRPELESQGPAVETADVVIEPAQANFITTLSTSVNEPEIATNTPFSSHVILSVWEDGGCWTPADARVLHLCGADAGDGYVIRWIGVAGDSRGPEIPDADWLAVRGGGDRLVWSGGHPATGEAVTVNYWAGGHVLVVHVAGRLEFRIDRHHGVK